MRTRFFLTGTVTTAIVATVLFSGCGSTSSSDDNKDASASDATTDASSNTDATAQKDASADRSTPLSDASTCETDADLNTIEIADASIGGGGATTGVCVPCIRTKCSAELTACNGECDCKLSVIEFFDCVKDGSSVVSCGQKAFISGGGTTGQGLALCILNSCNSECGVSDLLDGGNKDAAKDGTSDAPSDSGGGG